MSVNTSCKRKSHDSTFAYLQSFVNLCKYCIVWNSTSRYKLLMRFLISLLNLRMDLYNNIDRPLPVVSWYLEVILIKDWKLKINVEEMLGRVDKRRLEVMTFDEG